MVHSQTFTIDRATARILEKLTRDIKLGERPNKSLLLRKLIIEEAKRRGFIDE